MQVLIFEATFFPAVYSYVLRRVNEEKFPGLTKKAEKNFYMDNYISTLKKKWWNLRVKFKKDYERQIFSGSKRCQRQKLSTLSPTILGPT
jgi:hypothetical protein